MWWSRDWCVYRPTEEEIVCIRTVSSNFEDLDHVKELAVDIAHDCDRSLDVHDIALFHQQLFCFGTDGFNDRVGEEFFAVKTVDAFVEIYAGWVLVSMESVVVGLQEHTRQARHRCGRKLSGRFKTGSKSRPKVAERSLYSRLSSSSGHELD
jgi:hypothetical protein